METHDSPTLFLALTRRLERLQVERRRAWLMQDDKAEDKLAQRCFTLIGAILNISLPLP